MTKLTPGALDSVGKIPVTLKLDDVLFPHELVADCADRVRGISVVDGSVVVSAQGLQAWTNLREFCAELISAKRALL
jgi:hypothetical protein